MYCKVKVSMNWGQNCLSKEDDRKKKKKLLRKNGGA